MGKQSVEVLTSVRAQQQRRRIAKLAPPARYRLRRAQFRGRHLLQHAKNIEIGILRMMILPRGRSVEDHGNQLAAERAL